MLTPQCMHNVRQLTCKTTDMVFRNANHDEKTPLGKTALFILLPEYIINILIQFLLNIIVNFDFYFKNEAIIDHRQCLCLLTTLHSVIYNRSRVTGGGASVTISPVKVVIFILSPLTEVCLLKITVSSSWNYNQSG